MRELSDSDVQLQADALEEYVRRGGKLLTWMESKALGRADRAAIMHELDWRTVRKLKVRLGSLTDGEEFETCCLHQRGHVEARLTDSAVEVELGGRRDVMSPDQLVLVLRTRRHVAAGEMYR